MKTISFCLALLMHTTLLYAADGDLIVNGKLGVGSTNPSYKLEISGNAGSLGLLGIPTVAPGNNWAVFAGNVGGYMPPSSRGLNVGWNRSNYQGETNLIYGISAGTTPRLEIGSWDGSTYKSEMVIKSSNVGIGTTAPVSKLHLQSDSQLVTTWTDNSGETTHKSGRLVYDGGTWVHHGGWVFQKASDTGGFAANLVTILQNTGSIALGPADLTGDGFFALIFANGSRPASAVDSAGLYARADVNGVTQLWAFDEGGVPDTLISPHAGDAPDFLYDVEDGLPIIVKEIQYFLGYVRYTNQTRAARLAGMTDAEKKALSAQQRICVVKETFEEHETRTGEKFTQLVWEEEQAKIKQLQDTRRQTLLNQQAKLTNAIAAKTKEISAATDQSKLTMQEELVRLQQELSGIKIPEEYTIKPIPPRLQAALGK